MPLERDLVEVGRTQFNEPTIFCAHCHTSADRGQTVDESGNIIYTLSCPVPQAGGPPTLGSWQNEQQQAEEINEFIEGQLRAQERRNQQH